MFRNFLACLAVLVAAPFALAADDKADEKEVHCTYTKEKTKTCGVACRVNFTKELGVPLDYLSSIGHRISEARADADPVELALCSQALAVAEGVSGKKASITAEQVKTEALSIAKLRGISTELSAIALIVNDADTKRDLEKQVALAKKREADSKAALDSKEDTKELFGTLVVANHSDECLRIFVSGTYVGEVHTGTTASFHVHDHNNPTVLEAYCEEDGELVGNKYVFGHRHYFHWCIH